MSQAEAANRARMPALAAQLSQAEAANRAQISALAAQILQAEAANRARISALAAQMSQAEAGNRARISALAAQMSQVEAGDRARIAAQAAQTQADVARARAALLATAERTVQLQANRTNYARATVEAGLAQIHVLQANAAARNRARASANSNFQAAAARAVRSPALESAAALTSTVNDDHRSRVYAAKQIRTLMAARQHVFEEAKAMFPPSPEDIKATQQQCVNQWIEHTSQAAVSPNHCAVCSLDCRPADTHTVNASQFAQTAKKLLFPKHPDMYKHMLQRFPNTFNYGHAGLNGMVLHKAGVVAADTGNAVQMQINTCKSCWSRLQHGLVPKCALANNMFRGPTPPELEGLTLTEQLLISKYRTRVFLVKLRDTSGKGDPAARQEALKGSVTSFEHETEQAVEMLPAAPDSLVDQVAVLFVGTKKPHPDAFKRILEVRREKVRQALTFLAVHIPLYKTCVSQAQIDALPENGIPDSLRETIVHADRQAEQDDNRGYIPSPVIAASSGEGYTEADTATTTQPYLEEWSVTAVVDVNGRNVTANELRSHKKTTLQKSPAVTRPLKRRRIAQTDTVEPMGSDSDSDDSSDNGEGEGANDCESSVCSDGDARSDTLPCQPLHCQPQPCQPLSCQPLHCQPKPCGLAYVENCVCEKPSLSLPLPWCTLQQMSVKVVTIDEDCGWHYSETNMNADIDRFGLIYACPLGYGADCCQVHWAGRSLLMDAIMYVNSKVKIMVEDKKAATAITATSNATKSPASMASPTKKRTLDALFKCVFYLCVLATLCGVACSWTAALLFLALFD